MPEVESLHTTEDLTALEQKLVMACQQTRYGSICDLVIEQGQPAFDPAPRIRRSVRLNQKSILPEDRPTSFVLKEKHRLLFQLIREIESGKIERIDIRDGLPETVFVETSLCN
ncbi:MAG: hypothetical protein AAF394_02285 [Planctomycetota bacterium]